jgi:hypothetical protein
MEATETEFIPIGLIEGPAVPVAPDLEPVQQHAPAACKSGSEVVH